LVTTLTAAIANGTTSSITVASTAGLVQGMYIQIDSEILLITGVADGTTLDVARGQLGTMGAEHLTTGVNVTLAADQRGVAYQDAPDLGAFEFNTTAASPTTTTASSQTATFGTSDQSVQLTATVTSGTSTVNQGSVSFQLQDSQGHNVGNAVSGNLSDGSASVMYTLPGGTALGTYTIVATYNPGAGYSSSSDNTQSLVVGTASTTTAASSQTATFSTSAQSVTLSANVTSGGGTVNEGSVSFQLQDSQSHNVGSAVSANVSGGSASVTYTLPGGTAAGMYTIVATYTPGADYSGSSDSTHALTVYPAITVPAAQIASENVSQAVSGISIGAGTSVNVMVTLAVNHGTLTLGTTSGLTVTGNGGSVTLTGSTANLNAALATLAYRGGLNFSGADTLSLYASVGSITSNASVGITVVPIAQQATNLQALVAALLGAFNPGQAINLQAPATMQSAGVLNPGQASSLIVKLNLQGNRGDIGKVQAFLNEVQAYLKAGKLTQAQADALLGPGNILLQGLMVEFG
jgi:hypothetical protein